MFSPDRILHGGSLFLIAFVIFAETGLLFGFIFPGDSLLLIAGYYASRGTFNLATLLPAVIIAAILGYETGYEVGRKIGRRVFSREDGLLFRREYIEKTESFFKRHGGKTILLARFVPYVRTFVSAVAGVAKMNRGLFTAYNLVGGVLWAGGVTLLGYWLGNRLPRNFDKYVLAAAALGLVILHGGTLWHVWRDETRRNNFKRAIAQDFNYYIRRKS